MDTRSEEVAIPSAIAACCGSVPFAIAGVRVVNLEFSIRIESNAYVAIKCCLSLNDRPAHFGQELPVSSVTGTVFSIGSLRVHPSGVCEYPPPSLAGLSITDEQNTLQRKLKSPADIQRLKKTLNFGKIVRVTIYVADSYRKMKNIMHHASLKNIFQKLVIVNGATCLDFKNPSLACRMCVSVEALQYLAFATKKHGNNYLVFAGLSFFGSAQESDNVPEKPAFSGKDLWLA